MQVRAAGGERSAGRSAGQSAGLREKLRNELALRNYFLRRMTLRTSASERERDDSYLGLASPTQCLSIVTISFIDVFPKYEYPSR